MRAAELAAVAAATVAAVVEASEAAMDFWAVGALRAQAEGSAVAVAVAVAAVETAAAEEEEMVAETEVAAERSPIGHETQRSDLVPCSCSEQQQKRPIPEE